MGSFWISGLRAVGKKVPAAEMAFKEHLNVVSGASDTGKSYILQCLNYMLGAEEPPKSVQEDSGYDTLLLEITTNDNAKYSLRRSLKQGGEFLVYEQGLDADLSKLKGTILAWRHNPKRTDTMSSFLLGLCGLEDVVIKRKANAIRPLSFRDVCRFAIVNEEEIISEWSPVYPSRQYTKQTENKSVFDFLISSEDASSVIVAPDIATQKAGWRVRVELYDQLIRDLELETPEPLDSLISRMQKLDSRISELTEIIAANSNAVAEAQSSRIGVFEQRQKLVSRRGVVKDLIDRFSVLGDYYKSDIARLEFLLEGDHYMSQLGGDAHCPVCGSLLDGHESAHREYNTASGGLMRTAAQAEVAKLNVLIDDLDSTVSGLQVEMDEVDGRLDSIGEILRQTDAQITESLAPKVEASKEELQQLFDSRKQVITGISLRDKLDELVRQRQALGAEPKRTRTSVAAEATVGEMAGRRQFCNRVQRILKSWRYKDAGIVEFNETMDLVVGGVPRRSHGKGVRAILQSAFSVTLMLHAAGRHPGFVVLDSPLTSYRERDSYEADEDVQRGVFEYLSRLREGQVIVLENKDPPEDLQQQMQYVHFAGKNGPGRSGFFP